MKIVLLILLSALGHVLADYRPKPRGPPVYPYQIPPKQQYASKKLYRPPVRSRPPPPGPPYKQLPAPPPISAGLPPIGLPSRQPIRTFWKNKTPPSPIKFPVMDGIGDGYKMVLPPKSHKELFLGPAALAAQEFDYHIQANSIPTALPHPIKQIGEKGPIHTIPAPNLSLKDKPIVVEEVRYHQQQHKQQQQQQYSPYIGPEHQQQQYPGSEHSNQAYQVTEKTDASHKQKLYRLPPQVQQEMHQQKMIQQQQQQQKYHSQFQYDPLQQKIQQQLQEQQMPQHYQHQQQSDLDVSQQQKIQQQIQQQIQQHEQQFQQQQHKIELQQQPVEYYGAETIVIPPQNSQQQAQQQQQQQSSNQGEIYLGNNLGTKELYQLLGAAYPQAVAAQGTRQAPDYQAILSQQLFKPEQQSIGTTVGDSISFKPDFQSFNYDEQAHQKSQKGLGSLVTASYNLDSSEAGSDIISSRNANMQVSFDSRADVVEENAVEPDKQEKVDEKSLGSSFFSSLPSKEAAERLAQLQQAGKVNSKLMTIEKDPMEIIAEDLESEEVSRENTQKDDRDGDYDDYSKEDVDTSEKDSSEFGQRLKPTRKS
ncbi:unnamed protein product [Acanthoscelides obtectus]|uniref:Uncharacterized protein n=1 Tax=Acanthoscelides obtectus TaxID=200917 RepID=A0A9P0K016_ACAOB|nr:unnamed protein product [Acanthoscelides obtectus]CAK1625299.1 hypothetical protein AOBTE_LOCUS3094 [Acanthoscelides obtectus]